MNIKKKVYDNIVLKLQEEQRKIRVETERGKMQIASLVEAQTVRKREFVEINKLIYGLTSQGKE